MISLGQSSFAMLQYFLLLLLVVAVPCASGQPAASAGISNSFQSGLLTAGDVDDNLNFPTFLAFSNRQSMVEHFDGIHQQEQEQEQEQSTSSSSLSSSSMLLDISKRVSIRVSDAQGKAYSGAIVEVVEDDAVKKQYPVGTNGKLWLYPSLEGFEDESLTLRARDYHGSCLEPGKTNCSNVVEITPTTTSLSPMKNTNMAATMDDNTDNDAMNTGFLNLIVEDGVSSLPQQLDVAFVIDTTSSMCDELSYIQAELNSVINTVATDSIDTNIDIRIAIVLYRDEGDDYVVRTTSFTDIDTAVQALNKESCDGGGNFPEAMDQALQESAYALEWRSGADGPVARVLFVVADAPPHDENMDDAIQNVLALKSLGVRVYGLSASGVEETLEYFMRLLSLVTGGRFMFLTDDSGIGNAHAEPSILCYQVTRLDQLLVRVLRSELTGIRVEPDPDHIIREMGKQDRGVCIVDVEPMIDINKQETIVTEGIESVEDATSEGTAEGRDVAIAQTSDAATYYPIIHGNGIFMCILFMMLSAYMYVVWS